MMFGLEAFSVLSTLVIVVLGFLMFRGRIRLRRVETTSARNSHSTEILEDRFRWVFKLAPAPMAILTPLGSLIEVNEAWHEFIGISRENFPAHKMTFNVFADPYSQELGLDKLLRSVSESAVGAVSMPILWQPRDGSKAKTWVSVEFRPLRSSDGEYTHEVLVRFVDLTDKRHADIESKRYQKIMQALMANTNALIFVKDFEGRYIFVNNKWTQATGHKAVDTIGRKSRDIYPDKVATEFEEHDRMVLSLGHEVVTTNHLEFNGELREFSSAKFPIRDLNGKIEFLACIVTDVTEQKNTERERAELLVREKTAIEASHMKSAFLANMSHELRTPIHGIMGLADLLDATELGSQQKDFTDGIMHSADSLLTLVNDILDLSKAEAGKIDIESVAIDLGKIAKEVQSTLSIASWKKGIDLLIDLNENLPKEGIQGDPTRIRQVLMNLASNAIKFTDKGYVKMHICQNSDGRILFEVLDSGIGIDEATLPRLFSAFSQADASTTRKYGGTGLGLSISKHLVTIMDGEIGVDRRNEGGTRFWFWLPLKIATNAVPATVTLTNDSQSAAVGALRILVAEDNTTNQMIVSAALRNLGHTAVLADNGAEAIKALDHGAFDLILMDCQMPVMDGYEAARSIRKGISPAATSIPIIALTANAMRDDMEKCLAAGMSDYVSKPAKTVDLKSAIYRVMKNRERASA